MGLLAVLTGIYSKCHYFFFSALWLCYCTFYAFYNLKHGPSSIDHFSFRPRWNYNLVTHISVTSIFFFDSSPTNKLHGNPASPSKSLYCPWKFPTNKSLPLWVAGIIFSARFSASSGPHPSTKPHERMYLCWIFPPHSSDVHAMPGFPHLQAPSVASSWQAVSHREEGAEGREVNAGCTSAAGGWWENSVYGRCEVRDTVLFSERPGPQMTDVLLTR